MATITYRELEAIINKMTDEQKDKDITLHVQGEYYPAELLMTDTDDDVLGEEHPYFNIKDSE